MAVITLTTDYGNRDFYAAALKGHLLQQAPQATVVDISHDIQAFLLDQAAFVLGHAYAFFPKDTIHLVAVDEGRSSQTHGLLMRKDGHWFLGPDNGLFSLLRPELRVEKLIRLEFRREESNFPALDLYVPAAAHLARGGNPEVLGRETQQWEEKRPLRPTVSADNNSIVGGVLHIDRYGNLITNITGRLIEEYRRGRPLSIHMGRRQVVQKISAFYDETAEGETLAIINSMGYLEIALNRQVGPENNGASQLHGLYLRDRIEVHFK